ncbi:MAG: 2Fe-2S iron-sulfur cluster-binding protein [Acidiphilium sp.]|nr:2Fe-2S iron-sulfur cluster-binding protein [Acidiphilium sp.]MDD4936213.1 2Fe-2S iron-sulfur cluster-binding protein [Acidiphilium sp.]
MTAHRLPAGGLIDRGRPLGFTFDGKRYQGFAGDTLASALLANDVRLVGRSFKYHRPRGLIAAGVEEPNALVELRSGGYREPNTRATVVELFEGLEARSQNRFPSLKFDLLGVNSLLAPLFAAGFYYKTFMWPASFWEKLYEPAIRRAAGLGRHSRQADPDTYEKSHEFCDVLVIGGGTSGIAAAREAAAAGARVILCDEGFAPLDLPDAANLSVFMRCTVFGVYDGGTYGAVQRLTDHLPASHPSARGGPRQRFMKIVADRSILASGAFERPMVFGYNDLPGIMLAGAVATYVTRYAVAPGTNAVIFLNHDDVVPNVQIMADAGIAITAIVDVRATSSEAVRVLSHRIQAPVFAGAVIDRAHGSTAVSGVDIIDARGTKISVPCDLVAMSGGWNPVLHLTSHLDGKPIWDEAIAAFVPGTLPHGMQVVGAAAGCGINANIQPLWLSGQHPAKSFVDFQNDVTARDLILAKQEGFAAVEHLKRYTTLGMATDQGKTSNVNGLAILATETGKTIPETGTTRFRPPYTPVALGVLAGPHRGKYFKPTRLTPTHDFAVANHATFVEAGLWLRARYFAQGTEDRRAAVFREVDAVRNGVGFCDVTTLGKIDIQGPDSVKFLEFVYANGWNDLAIGRVRYGLMLREDGFVMDDGTCARLGQQHFVMTTTTANAAKVMQHMEFCHQVLAPALDVCFVSVTDQWAQLAIAGPHARRVLQRLVDPPFDLSNDAFPHMAAAVPTICGGIAARLFRLSFSGELGYELAVPARYGNALAAQLMQTGADFNITPYGTEALGVMRIEKGHPAGPELNGQTTAHDLGLARLLSRKKDYVGRALAARPALTDPHRPTLVGLKPCDRRTILRAGSHLLRPEAALTAANDEGFVTSAIVSPTLGYPIALALLANGPARIGETIRVYDPIRNGDVLADIVAPVFHDPAGSRRHA